MLLGSILDSETHINSDNKTVKKNSFSVAEQFIFSHACCVPRSVGQLIHYFDSDINIYGLP